MFVLILLNICLNVLIVSPLTDDSKRLLLNDPDVILDRLTKLENLVVQLQSDNSKLTQENQQHTLNMKAMEISISTLQSEYHVFEFKEEFRI